MSFVLVFFFIYAIALKFLPAELYTARIISLFAMILFLLRLIHVRGKVSVHPDIIFVLSAYFAYCIWVAGRTIIAGADDISLLINSSLFFLQVAPGALLVTVWIKKDCIKFRDLILLLHATIVVQGFLIVLTFVSWEFRLLTLDLLHEAGSNVDAFHPYRVRGLTHNTGAKLSAFQATAFFFTAYLLKFHHKGPVFWYLILSVPILMGSVLLTGRVGFVGFGIAVAFAIWWIRLGQSSRGLLKGFLLVPVVGLAGYLLLESLYLMTGGREMAWGEDAFQSMIRWVVSEFVLYIDARSFDESTVASLLREHLIWPQDNLTFFIGDPSTWSVRRIDSDIGVVRMIFGTGLVGAALLYSGASLLFLVARKYLDSKLDRSLLLGLFVWMCVFELKEPSFMDLRYASLLAIILVFVVWTKEDQLERNIVNE
jgi:hypothetical protein